MTQMLLKDTHFHADSLPVFQRSLGHSYFVSILFQGHLEGRSYKHEDLVPLFGPKGGRRGERRTLRDPGGGRGCDQQLCSWEAWEKKRGSVLPVCRDLTFPVWRRHKDLGLWETRARVLGRDELCSGARFASVCYSFQPLL